MKILLRQVLFLFVLVNLVGCSVHSANIPQSASFPVKIGWAAPTPARSLQSFAGWQGSKPAADKEIRSLYVESFVRLLFHTEMQGEFPYIRKFNRPVKIWFIGDGSERLVHLALSLKEPLELVSGIPFGLARNLSESNLLVSIASKGASTKHCYTDRNLNADGSVFRATIYIGPNYSRHPVLHCLTEEISQSYGPSNDIDVVKESLWRPMENGKETNLGLTWHDAVILRTLYDERLKPGMHRDQAMPLVRQIIREVLEDINR